MRKYMIQYIDRSIGYGITKDGLKPGDGFAEFAVVLAVLELIEQ
jgi:hypothetical protein